MFGAAGNIGEGSWVTVAGVHALHDTNLSKLLALKCACSCMPALAEIEANRTGLGDLARCET